VVTSVKSVNGSALQPQVANTASPQSKPETASVGTGSAETVSISPADSFQLGRDQSIAAGKLVNQTGQTMGKQQDTLSHMNDKAMAIVKQFPPYGAADPQRLAFLKEFSELRKEIEPLQFPKDSQAEQGLPNGVAKPRPESGSAQPGWKSD